MVILDTDIMIDLLRGYSEAIKWIKSLGDEEIILPGFVVMELIQGCRNNVEQKKLKKELRQYNVLWPTPEICDEALSIFSYLHLKKGMGIIDVLIGEIAVALGLPLYTFNLKHYNGIPNLETIQPYKKK